MQVFLNNGERVRRWGPDFARRRSGVRLPSAPLENVHGGGGDCRLRTVNGPAANDIVYCGDGIDYVEVDSADPVAPDCEDVKVERD